MTWPWSPALRWPSCFFGKQNGATGRAAAAFTLAIGLLLGLSILTKGLAGVALVGIAYSGYLLFTRRLTPAICIRGAAALLLAGLVGSTWYVAMELRSPGFLRYYFIDRHLLGFATGTQIHGSQPWWYYLPVLLLGGLPWIGYLPVLVQDQWEKRHDNRDSPCIGSPMILLACWLVGCTLFLSISHSKLETYIWPIFPALAILGAVAWIRLFEGTLSSVARRMLARTLCFSCLTGPAVLPVVLLIVQRLIGLRLSVGVWAAAVCAAIFAAVPLWFWIAGRFRAALAAALLSTAVQFIFLMTAVLPQVAEGFSARGLAAYFNRQGEFPAHLLMVEERIGSLVFYLDDRLRSGLDDRRVQSIALADMLDTRVVEPQAVVVMAERRVVQAAKQGIELNGIPYQRADGYRLYRAADLPARHGGGGGG